MLIDEKAPPFANAIPDNDRATVVDRVLFKSAIDRVATLANKTVQTIRLNFTNGEVLIDTIDINYGTGANEVIKCEYSGEDMQIAFKATQLLPALSHMVSDVINLNFSNPKRAMIIREEISDSKDNLMLVMPVSL